MDWSLRNAVVGAVSSAIVAVAISTNVPAADAKATYASPYGYLRTWNAALRFVRVDNGWKVDEKDESSGYMLFQYRSPESTKATPGSLQIIRGSDGDSAVSVLVELGEMPHYHEQLVLDGLAKKMRREYGDAPARKRDSAPVEPRDGGTEDAN